MENNNFKWQSIETAPRDGTEIIATGKTNLPHLGDKYYVEFTHWGKSNGIGQFLFCVGNYSQPTHWQPKPVPPQAREDL